MQLGRDPRPLKPIPPRLVGSLACSQVVSSMGAPSIIVRASHVTCLYFDNQHVETLLMKNDIRDVCSIADFINSRLLNFDFSILDFSILDFSILDFLILDFRYSTF